MKRTFAVLLLALTLLSTFGPGCRKKGPFEEAGEEIDETVRDVEREVEDATD